MRGHVRATYDAAMRRWLLVFMVLLLPLRGWVGEAMAGEMLQQEVVVASTGAHHAGIAGDDCDHHGAAADPDEAQAQAQPGGDCPTCAACQVCSSVALWPPEQRQVVTGFHHPPPQQVQVAFTSAEPLLAFKPPKG